MSHPLMEALIAASPPACLAHVKNQNVSPGMHLEPQPFPNTGHLWVSLESIFSYILTIKKKYSRSCSFKLLMLEKVYFKMCHWFKLI